MVPRSYATAVQAAGAAGADRCRPTTAAIEAPDRCSTASTPCARRRLRRRSRHLRRGAAPRDERHLARARPLRARAGARGRSSAACRCSASAAGMQMLNVALRRHPRPAPPRPARQRRPPPHAGRLRRPRGAARAGLARGAGGGSGADHGQVPPPSGDRRAGRGAGRPPAGRSSDELVEAIELPGHRFALGVLWHPGGGRAKRRDRGAGRAPRGRRWARR